MASSKSMTSSPKSKNTDHSSSTSQPQQQPPTHSFPSRPIPKPPFSSSVPHTDAVFTSPLMLPPPPPGLTVFDGVLRNTTAESTLLEAEITLVDSQMPLPPATIGSVDGDKNLDDMWQELVAGKDVVSSEEMKEEQESMMTLEDFLVKTGVVKTPVTTERLSGGVYAFDTVVPESAFGEVEVSGGGGGAGGGGRGKRGRTLMMEPMDKAAQQRQRRMIKNRESAARSRERKQAYQVELESLSVSLTEENEQLLKEEKERSKQRYKQLMENVHPAEEKRRPPKPLRRVRSI